MASILFLGPCFFSVISFLILGASILLLGPRFVSDLIPFYFLGLGFIFRASIFSDLIFYFGDLYFIFRASIFSVISFFIFLDIGLDVRLDVGFY